MLGNDPLMIEDASGNAAPEMFALTDEQILELEPEGMDFQNGSAPGSR